MNCTEQDLKRAKDNYLKASDMHQGYFWMNKFKTIYRIVRGEVVLHGDFQNKLKEV